MKWPQHCTPADAHQRATAPFNFVPLPEAILPSDATQALASHDRYEPELHHGWIDLDILTETPLYTRCAYPLNEAHREVKESEARQQFYHHRNPAEPVIPGSSIRGAIRNLVAILSYARLSRLESSVGASTRANSDASSATGIRDEKLVYRAVTDQKTSAGKEYNEKGFLPKVAHMTFEFPSRKVKAGWLEKSPDGRGMQIRPACEHEKTSFVRVPVHVLSQARVPLLDQAPPRPLFVEPASVQKHTSRSKGNPFLYCAKTPRCSTSPSSGLVEATLIQSGKAPTRHYHTAIYPRDTRAAPIPISPTMWEQYVEDRELTRGIPTRKLSEGAPCFYLLDRADRLVFFGPTLFFRIPYQRSTADFMPRALLLDGELDVAEALFGTVNPGQRMEGQDSGPFRGRVRFGDACYKSTQDGGTPFESDAQGGRRVPGILSAPKPTSFQNYLVQVGNGEAHELLSYASSPAEAQSQEVGPFTVLRGHKRYWHRGKPLPSELSTDLELARRGASASQYTIIRPVRAGTRFEGRIHFDNLTLCELGVLLTALDLPSECRHHLGMGRPLGMGSVRITPKLTLWSPEQRYASFDGSGALDEAEVKQLQLRAMEAFRARVMKHHLEVVRSPKLRTEDVLWQVPRLQTLRLLLSWDGRPDRKDTAYQELKRFAKRPTLPTPQAVMRQPDPKVDAEVPVQRNVSQGSSTSTLPAPSQADHYALQPSDARGSALPGDNGQSPMTPSKKAQFGVSATLSGQIIRRTEGEVILQVDGSPELRKVILSTDLFPTQGPGAWPRLSGSELRYKRRVRIETMNGQFISIKPE